MSVAVSCNLADGLILGVDSAVTINDPSGGVAKIYENATKLFQLGEKPIGIATFGLGSLGTRGIGSYVRQFEKENPNEVVTDYCPLDSVVEELRVFFLSLYKEFVADAYEQQTGKKFSDLPVNNRPILGFAVGGYSGGSYLSQVWEILIPIHETPKSATLLRKEGDFGSNWFALNQPIFRYLKGFDRNLLDETCNYLISLLGRQLQPAELAEIQKILAKFEYRVPYFGMPLAQGIAHVRFLVELVISHHKYSLGASVVGGKARIGVVDYKGDRFLILPEEK
jgi:hypothetical protein